MEKEEWDRAFLRVLPVASLGIGVLGVALGIWTLQRSSPLGQRAYYEDGHYLVAVRHPGQWNDLRDFVQPSNPDVVTVYHQYGPAPWNLFNFVCQSVQYVADIGEWWAFPSEVLAGGQADCEDTSNLLTSLLRCGGLNASTVLGDYQGYGHAWTVLNGFIYETTYMSARRVADPQNYRALVVFNSFDVRETYAGAFEDIFSISRDEEAKLNLMAVALEASLG